MIERAARFGELSSIFTGGPSYRFIGRQQSYLLGTTLSGYAGSELSFAQGQVLQGWGDFECSQKLLRMIFGGYHATSTDSGLIG